MAFTFADTHNMIAFLTKSDASDGFDQIIDFLNASVIKYELTVNPNIYVSVIKKIWSSVSIKKVNDVVRLQDLIDRKKVIITKVTVREALRLDDAESIDCLPNEEIFTELARMGEIIANMVADKDITLKDVAAEVEMIQMFKGEVVNTTSATITAIATAALTITTAPSATTYKYPDFSDKVYKVEKALHGLHQAPRACQDKYVVDILKKFDFSTVKIVSTPIEPNKAFIKDAEAKDRIFRYLKGQPKLGLWYLRDSPFDLEAYSDSDYAGASLDRKSTIGGCQFLSKRLISWQCKKQTIVANYTIEAEYVAAASFYGQVLWIQNQMLDYGFNLMNTEIYFDNESTICIVKNPMCYSTTKHIEIWHHFIRDSYEKKLIQVIKIYTDYNVVDLLTKAFDEDKIERAATNASSLEAKHDSGSGPRCQVTILRGVEAQTRFEATSKHFNDPPLLRVHTLKSDEDSIKLKELME
nr:putative ribonuclease H-like domain-containing protein [Tanacetum cinerariifolium]